MKKFLSLVLLAIMTFTLFGCSLANEHQHTFSKDWIYDEDYHWHESECAHDVISGKSRHVFTNGKCDFCGYESKVESSGNMNNDFDLKRLSSNSRYEIHSAPIHNNSLPLIDASTDYVYNYYLLDAGYIKNVPIVHGVETRYDGKHSPTITYSKSTVTTEEVASSIEKTASETISNTTMNAIGIGVEGSWGWFTASLEYSRQWGTTIENKNSFTSVYTIANQTSEGMENSISYTIGEPTDEKGYYRISLVTTCDVYYLAKTNRDNTKLIDFTVFFCARGSQQFVLEYSENGDFNKDNATSELTIDNEFYKNFEIPTKVLSNTITLDECGGYTISQNDHTVIFGADYKLPTTQKIGYAFVGWYSQPDGQGMRYTDHNGNSLAPWGDSSDKTLYAHWIRVVSQISIGDISLGNQSCYSAKSSVFQIDLDIETLRSIGYTHFQITIGGACRDYDYKMNNRGRYFVLSDVLLGDLVSWKFKVSGFSDTGSQNLYFDSVNPTGSYQIQLVSDKSDAYNEKLTVGNVVIYITVGK
ncbi:MAG: InlB B-repeat-containing protein [Christensenellaceae bacterium]